MLFVVAYNMGEWRQVGAILRLNTAVKMVWVATFALTVVADLTVAVEVGMTLAALLYIYRVTQTTTIARVTPEYIAEGRPHTLQDKDIPDYVATRACPDNRAGFQTRQTERVCGLCSAWRPRIQHTRFNSTRCRPAANPSPPKARPLSES